MKNLKRNPNDKNKYYLTEDWSSRGVRLQPLPHHGRIIGWDVMVAQEFVDKKTKAKYALPDATDRHIYLMVASAPSLETLDDHLEHIKNKGYVFNDFRYTKKECPAEFSLKTQ